MEIGLNRIPGYPPAASRYVLGTGAAGEWTAMPTAGSLTQLANKHPAVDRAQLVSVLRDQYRGIEDPPDFAHLENENTFTICTGQQLCVAMGPLYVLYKILHTISAAHTMNELKDGNRYVPVFWMASEDHDIEEISMVRVYGKQLAWKAEQTGAAGRLSVNGIEDVLDEMAPLVAHEAHGRALLDIFHYAYRDDLASSYRRLLHRLFGHRGLVVVDADDKRFKSAFADIMINDATRHTLYALVSKELNQWKGDGLKPVVNPRKINLFFIDQDRRVRIDEPPEADAIRNHPENYSPNVLLRPVYQEFILPNVAYIAGPTELAYWLELRTVFPAFALARPALLPRASFSLITPRQAGQMQDYGLGYADLLNDVHVLAGRVVKERLGDDRISIYREKLNAIIGEISSDFAALDASLEKSVQASGARMQKELNILESKYIKTLKRINSTDTGRIERLHDALWPEGIAQERVQSMIGWYAKAGDGFFDILLENIAPFEAKSKLLAVDGR